MAPLRYTAKFDPFLSLDCAPTPSTLAQSKERKGSTFAIWKHCVPERPVGDDDGVVELSEGVGARGGDAVVADARVAAVQVVEAQLVRVVQQDLGRDSVILS